MRILLFEWFSSGGLLVDQTDWPDGFSTRELFDQLVNCEAKFDLPVAASETESILRQGFAMLASVAVDLRDCGYEVILPIDGRIPSHDIQYLEQHGFDMQPLEANEAEAEGCFLESSLRGLADVTDRTLVIAPEIGGCLERVAGWFDSEKLLSPSPEFIRAVSNKMKLAHQLQKSSSIKIPPAFDTDVFNGFIEKTEASWPMVMKPKLGAGSTGVQLLRSEPEFRQALARIQSSPTERIENYFVQRFTRGIPVSCNVILNQNSWQVLPPTEQVLHPPDVGEYCGWTYPVEQVMEEKIRSLVDGLVPLLPPSHGWIGIDMVAEPVGDSWEIWLIEINPRLTMSYLAMRQIQYLSPAKLMMSAVH